MSKFLTDCVFLGREVEGPDRGVSTLFIATHTANPDKIWSWVKSSTVRRVYFGAGGKYGLPKYYFNLATTLLSKDYRVLVEANRIDHVKVIPLGMKNNPNMDIVMCFTTGFPTITEEFCKFIDAVTIFKFVDKKRVMWVVTKYGDKRITYLDDPLYQEDNEVQL